MRIPNWLRIAAGSSTRKKLRRRASEFLAASKDCRQTQQDVLRRLLALNAGSDFSREHKLGSVRNSSDFRRQLPVADYEFFRPYIDQLKVGNHGALLGSDNRLLMFALSSGTTSDSKFIPITRQFLADYRRGWLIWGIRAYDDHPSLIPKNILQLSSDDNRFLTAAGTPCGNISGLAASMQRRVVRSMYTVPAVVSKVEDPEAKYYAALRLALADDQIGMITTANPSTLAHLAQMADARKESLIRDIRDGSLDEKYDVGPQVRRALARRIGKPNRVRARQLEAIVEQTGNLYPRDYWPNLDLLAIWTAGSCGAYVRSLGPYFGDVTIRDHGLSASEGRMTIPLHDGRPEGILDVTTHYFEFIPEAEYGNEDATVLEAHELTEGHNYFILLTTSSGLCRYDICDVVQCRGFHETTPLLTFLHKGAHISNITGEKVSESQVVDAVNDSVEQMQISLGNYSVIPVWDDPPQYQLMVEAGDLPESALGDGLANHVEERLQELNCEYREKRLSGRLAPMKFVSLPKDTWRAFSRERQSKLGGSIEQYKHPCLIPDMEYSAQFLRKYAIDPAKDEPKPKQLTQK